MSNTHKIHPKTDKHDKHFMEHVEKSTYVIEHELVEIDHSLDKIHDLESLLHKQMDKKKK